VTLTFYDYKMAPSPRRTRIMLAEKQVKHQVVQVDMMTNEQMGETYRAINPNCTIPALRLEDGTVLTDNAGITVWLEETFPEPALLGSTPLEKAEIASWNWRVENEFGMAVASALRNKNPAMQDRALPGPHNYEQIPALAERGFKQIDNFFSSLEEHLASRKFIASNSLSVADITCFCFMEFAKVVRRQPTEGHPHIVAWWENLRKRPAFQL
jgi:glutathione S-transferase